MADRDGLNGELLAIPLPAQLSERSRLGIRQAALERQEEQRSRRRSRFIRLSAAAAAVMAVCIVAASFADQAKVRAAVQKMLQYVPGIGMMKEEEARADRYVLRRPIELAVGEGSVTIMGIMVDETATAIRLMGNDMATLHQNVTVVDAQGTEYILGLMLGSGSDGEWSVQYGYKGRLDASGPIKLLLFSSLGSNMPAVEVPVTLDKAEIFERYSAIGNTQTVNGISITAITNRAGDKARVSLVSEHAGDFEISDYGMEGVELHHESMKLNVKDAAGTKIDIRKLPAMSGPVSEIAFQLPAGREEERYTLTIPEISVTYPDKAAVELDVETNDHLNQTFELAGFPVTVTRTEISDHTFRAYFDFHYDASAPASLHYFANDRNSYAYRIQEGTGVLEYLEFELAPDSKKVELVLSKPSVVVRGPWTFELPSTAFETDNGPTQGVK